MMKKTQKEPNTPEKNKRIRRRVLILLASFLLQLGIYIAISSLGVIVNELFYTVGFTVYLTIGAVLLVLYYILNGASFSSSKAGGDEKALARREKARRLHYILLPMAVLLLIVFADMYFGESIRSILG